jgi:rfaE bifunctional protein nucleotidyltransferase chain/domain
MGKVVSREEAARISAELKAQGKKVVTTNGAFDMLHVGHTRYLEVVKKEGDVFFVGVNSDSSVRQYKSPDRPIIPENDRAELLAALSVVDYVVIFPEPDPRGFLEAVKPNVHVKGDDYDPEHMIETPVVRKHGGEVKIVSARFGSSTAIINKIAATFKGK